MTEPVHYSPLQRTLHWVMVLGLIIIVPLGFYMVRRYFATDFDALTKDLFNIHTLLGLLLLATVAIRLGVRLSRGVPAHVPPIAPWQHIAAEATHWAIYALLLAVPLAGWIGVQLYPALDIFGLFSLPAFLSPDNARSGLVLGLHGSLALALFVLLGMHTGAALFHYVIRKDGVLNRMIPVLPPAKRN